MGNVFAGVVLLVQLVLLTCILAITCYFVWFLGMCLVHICRIFGWF